MTNAATSRIGFLVKTYPKVSETFILGEILGLERCGVPLHIFSLQRPTDDVSHAATANVAADVSYVLAASWTRARALATLREQLQLLLTNPRRYFATLIFALRCGEANRLKTFLQAGSLALQARNADVAHLHAHFASEPATIAELAHKLSGLTYSISAHAKDIYLSDPVALRRKLNSACFTVTCTEYNRRHLAAVAGPEARVLRMYHGVDIERFDPATVAATPQQGPALILSVGRLREKKGFPILINACRRLADEGVAFRCEIVGYGPDAEKLQTLIDRSGLRSLVQLVGKLTHEQLILRYRAATLFVLPCQISADGDRDGIPNVLLEAMAMQLPVVSTDVSGIPEVVQHRINGLIVPPENSDALMKAMRCLIENPAMRKELGANGRQVVAARFSNETNLKLLRSLLLNAAHGDNTKSVTENGSQQIFVP